MSSQDTPKSVYVSGEDLKTLLNMRSGRRLAPASDEVRAAFRANHGTGFRAPGNYEVTGHDRVVAGMTRNLSQGELAGQPQKAAQQAKLFADVRVELAHTLL